MTLRHLYIFIAVYQEMSITKAAERLHLAQPRVSQAVKELEEEYGVRLFERLNRKLFVTEKGERLYDYAVHLLELSQEMEEDLLSSGNGGRIRLGSSITAGAFLVPERAARFQDSFPLFLREKGSASREITENYLKNCQLSCQPLWESVSNEALIQAIQKNPGITVLSGMLVEKEMAEGKIKNLPLCPDVFCRQFSLIYHRKKYLTESMKNLIQLFTGKKCLPEN